MTDQTKMDKFFVKKVVGPIDNGAAVFLGNDRKTFVVFVGLSEAAAIMKEIQKQKSIRPLPHDLMHNIFIGFDIEVKKIIISRIVDNTFCATIILDKKLLDPSGQWSGHKQELHVDARASDSIILALKTTEEIWVTSDVYEKVEDVSDQIRVIQEEKDDENWVGTELDDVEFDFPNFKDSEDNDEDT